MACLAGMLPPAARGQQQPDRAAITCTNPASGASWQVMIDYPKSTVDANPAEITPAAISWFDPKDGGHYTLDRKTGKLTATVASSTGGYFRHGRCALGKPR
ncbi:MAG TPA: hypothetical protein VGR91_02545 [Stellaceae bacterium]|nr:hypothetical protein [Stellaceae bacterium]